MDTSVFNGATHNGFAIKYNKKVCTEIDRQLYVAIKYIPNGQTMM